LPAPSSRPACVPGRLLYLRLSVTDHCNLRCRYCRPEVLRAQAPLSDQALVQIVEAIDASRPVGKIRITGGEPLLRPRLPALIRTLADRLPRAELVLTTNGVLLAPLARALRRAGLRTVNVSLDAVAPPRFAALTGGRLEPVLRGIDAAVAAGLAPVKLNAVLMRSVNGDHLQDIVELAVRKGCQLRFIELMPIGVAARIHEREFLSSDEALSRLSARFPRQEVLEQRGTARLHRLSAASGDEAIVGFITAVSHPFCNECNRLRLDATGRLIACLRQDPCANLAGLDRAGIEREVTRALEARLASTTWSDRSMVAIGG